MAESMGVTRARSISFVASVLKHLKVLSDVLVITRQACD